MSQSPHLGLSYLAPAQAEKHVTVNETFRRLDALVQLGVLDRTLTAPPPSPAEGDRHIVAAGATGAWTGHDTEIAAFLDGTWVFVEPKPGWLAYVAAEGALLVFLSGAWLGALGSLASLDALTKLGVNTTADLVNRLAVASQAVLFTHDGAGVQLKLNKAAAGDTASLLLQRGFSGRAELGLAGSDAFGLKVSPDGSAWSTALTVDPATAAVDLPQTPRIRVDKFVASGTWSKPAWATTVRVVMVGGGAGGGSGALRPASTAVSGGGGGAPGAYVDLTFQTADLPATVAVTVGAGGAGGAAQSVAGGNGAAGAAGGATLFGTFARASGGSPGAAGSTATAAGGSLNGGFQLPPSATIAGGSGTTGAGGSGVNSAGGGLSGGGAGGGGGLSAANAEGAGGGAGNAHLGLGTSIAVSGGAAPGGAGGDGPAATVTAVLVVEQSGGGGAGGAAVNGGRGGDGQAPGGAGGGGGASRDGLVSGRGGNGGRGEAWVISMW